MSVPTQSPSPDASTPARSGPNLLRSALWVAIGALILAAIVCVVWVLIGPENGIIGRAFLTILLLAGFAGVAILDAQLAPRRPTWLILTSMVVWVFILLDGAFLIWMPIDDYFFGGGFSRFVSFVLIVAVLQLALLHVRLFLTAHRRYVTGLTTAITWITVALVAILAVLLVFALTLHEFIDFEALYWRIVVAITILAAVGTALVPLINALLAPKKPAAPPAGPYPGYSAAPYPGYPAAPAASHPAPGSQPTQAAPAQAAPAQAAPTHLPPWPTFADGVTPLPVLPDGSPDWNAYYTGYPTYPPYPPQGWQPEAPQQAAPPQQAAAPHPGTPQPGAAPQPPAQPGYQGYPPPPPAPH